MRGSHLRTLSLSSATVRRHSYQRSTVSIHSEPAFCGAVLTRYPSLSRLRAFVKRVCSGAVNRLKTAVGCLLVLRIAYALSVHPRPPQVKLGCIVDADWLRRLGQPRPKAQCMTEDAPQRGGGQVQDCGYPAHDRPCKMLLRACPAAFIKVSREAILG